MFLFYITGPRSEDSHCIFCHSYETSVVVRKVEYGFLKRGGVWLGPEVSVEEEVQWGLGTRFEVWGVGRVEEVGEGTSTVRYDSATHSGGRDVGVDERGPVEGSDKKGT